MENRNLIIYIAIAVPLLAVGFFTDKKSRITIISLFLGLTVCLFCGEINTLLFNALPFPKEIFVTNISPLVEEICKAIPIISYAFLFLPNRRELLSFSFTLGVGFAILENAAVFSFVDKYEFWTALLRGFGCGISHGLCSMAIGYGCSFIFKRRKLFYTGTFALLSLSIIFHATYNLIIEGGFIIIGTLLPTIILIIFVIVFYTSESNRSNL